MGTEEVMATVKKKTTRKPAAKLTPKKNSPAKSAKKATEKLVKSAIQKYAPDKKKKAGKKVAVPANSELEKLRDKIVASLDKAKAEDVVTVDVRGQSSLTDFFVIASGRSNRQVKAIADDARRAFVAAGVREVHMEGLPQADWVVVDGGDVIVHIFRPEVRLFYRLEEVWGLEPPLQDTLKNL